MANNEDVQRWWDARTDEERDVLREGNKQYPMSDDATKLLFDSKCPALPVGATFDVSEGFAFGMPAEVADVFNREGE